MSECEKIKKDGSHCRNSAEPGARFCYFHNVDENGRHSEPAPMDLAKEIRILEKSLRSVQRLPQSLERAKVTMELVKLLEQLREPKAKPSVKDLTVEERLALRGK
jgi:hypothetical protein